MRDIEGHGSLVQIVEPEEKAAIMMRRLADEWTDSARGVAAGRFDLDDVGTHVGEQARRKMGAIGAQIEHAQARKRAVAHYLTLPGALPRFSISSSLIIGIDMNDNIMIQDMYMIFCDLGISQI